jgi:hypothetical protein
MFLTLIAIWLVLAVPVAVFVAALGRSALREDEALGYLPTPLSATNARRPDAGPVRPAQLGVVAEGVSEGASAARR